MSKVDSGALAFDYQRAFCAANPQCSLPNVIYRNGWFRIGEVKVRRTELVEMTERLWNAAISQQNG